MLKIEGIDIPTPLPGGFVIKSFKISDSKRLASGTMSSEFIAAKRQFQFTYTVLAEQDYIKIRNLLDLPKMFYSFDWEEDSGGIKNTTVYPGALGRNSYRTGNNLNGWYWKNVSFSLIER